MIINTSDKQAIAKLFAGREEGLPLFNIVLEYIESLGDIKLDAIKTQIAFVGERKFASVLLPQMWLKGQLRALLALSFNLPARVDDSRINHAVEQSSGCWTHQVVIKSKEDFDDSVKGWLKEAYTQAAAH
jgi:hypothetical protein